MHEGDGFLAKTHGKSLFHFQTDWSGRPVLTNGKRPMILYEQILKGNDDKLVEFLSTLESATPCR